MDRIDGLIVTFALNALWQLPAAVAAGLLGDRLLRRAPARLRHALWLAVLIVALALPASSLWPSRPPAAGGASPAAAPLPDRAAYAAAWRAAFPSDESRFPAGASAAVAGLWALSLLIYGCGLGRAWDRAQGLARRAHPLEIPDGFAPVVARCRAALGVPHGEILGSAELAGPVTLGWRRPSILLPSRFFAGASVDETAAALGHELAHVRRRDWAVHCLCELLLLPVAFHPAVRFLRRRLAETREMACDEAVVESLVGARAYARSLLSLAVSATGLPRPSTTLGVLDAQTLEVRMKRILDSTPRAGSRPARAALGAALLLLGGIAVAASEVTVRPVAAADARGGALGPFVGTWSADWTPDPKDGGKGKKVRALDLEVHPDGRIVETWYKYRKEGDAPQKLVLPVTDYTVEGNTLKFAVRVKDFALPDKPAGTAELRESMELQGGDDAVWRSLSNSYIEALKKRGEPVPPLPPPTPMKRRS
jgi:beta-lactamase regulating signal transducer with metallopeptidase domain